MMKEKKKELSRRNFLEGTVGMMTGSVCAGPFFLFPARALSRQKRLRILQWKHPVPEYDNWFDNVFAREWGRKHDTRVIIDHVPVGELARRAQTEVKARSGHDLVMFPSPPATYEKYVINHAEVHEEVWGKQGQINQLGYKSSYNPKTQTFYAFADSYIPTSFNYRRDYWMQIGVSFGPSNYDSLRQGAKRIHEKLGIPGGLGLAEELDSNIALHGLLLSFGGSVQDERGEVTIYSKNTLEALKYVKALYQETLIPEVFSWNSDSNDRALIDGKVTFVMNAVSTVRQAERESREFSERVMINPALKGPVRWLSHPQVTSCYVIWKFAENKEAAKHFLIDLVAASRTAFKMSGFCNLPCFPKTIPNLKLLVEDDPTANPKHKYACLQDALVWTTNIGHPGYTTAAIAEVFHNFVIPKMFAAVAKGQASPEDGATQAERQIKQIFEKWKKA